VERTLTKVKEIIRGADMLNCIAELLILRLDCDTSYPRSNNIKLMTKIIIYEIAHLVFNEDPTNFTNYSSPSSSSNSSPNIRKKPRINIEIKYTGSLL
jgi:hypothetical protein